MAKMSEYELLAILNTAEQDASVFNGELSALNTRLLKDYLQEPYGDEVEDQSQVISPDVQDVVESDMPSLARVFLGSKQPIMFEATTSNPQEEQEIEEKNKYVHHLVMEQPSSYNVLFAWMKEASILKSSAIKYFMEDCRKTREVHYENVDEGEFAAIVDSLEGDWEIVGQEQNEDLTYNLSFKITEGKQELRIINVPSESFLISKNATCVDDALLVGDRISKTRGELISEGYKRKLIEQLPASSSESGEEIRVTRNQDTGSGDDDEMNHWANQKVELRDLYVKLDYDGDGIAERRHILKSGNHILVNEAFDHVPYATLSGLLMPHRVVGRSRAEITQQTQKIKTVVLRQTLDNMYMVNHPRNVVHPDVNIDDILNVRPNGLVRMKRSTTIAPQQAVFPLQTPYVGDKSLQIMTYLDHMRSQSTGMLQASQGLDGTGIAEETATRFKGVEDDAKAKIELVSRNFAETGYRKLYEGVAWMVSQYQDTEREVMVLGKPLTVNPQNWKYSNQLVVKVGTGSGDNDKLLQNLSTLLQMQLQMFQMGSPLVDQVKLYNTFDEMVEALGIKQSEKFFNNPEDEEQLKDAKIAIYEQQLQQAQQMLQQSNPLAEAEMIKQQAMLTKAQSDAQIKVAELQEKQNQFVTKMEADKDKYQQDMALKLTELEIKAKQDLDSELMSNALVFDEKTGTFSGQL